VGVGKVVVIWFIQGKREIIMLGKRYKKKEKLQVPVSYD
jgi:hypothetical protein